jgi:O-antigen ligase
MGRLVRALVTLVCIVVGMQAVLRGGSIGQIATVFTWVAAVVVAYQVVSFALGHQPSIQETVEDDTFRYSGIFGNPNQAASFCVLLVCLSLLAPLSAKLRLALACLAVTGLLATFSRGGFATFAAVCAANAMVGNARGRVAFLLAFCAAVVSALVAIPLLAQSGALPPAMAKHIIGLHELMTGRAAVTDNSRGMLVAQALHAIESHPITGYGFGRYYTLLVGKGSHNMYTHLALLAGIPAAMLYTTATAALGWFGYLLKDQSERRFVVSIAAWMAAMGLSSHNLFDEKYSVLLLSMACAIVAVRLAPTRAREHAMKLRPLPTS